MEITNQVLCDLHGYWDSKRAGRDLPSRSDIDPLDIPRILPNLILFDVEPGSRRLKVRLVGTAIVELYGGDYTGQYLDEIDFGDRREQILEDYAAGLELRQPSVSNHLFWNLRGSHIGVERLILPLSDDQKDVNMLLVGIAFKQL